MNYGTLVSVIITSYNRLTYFSQCLDSVVNQTYPNLEIIVSDDSDNDQIESYLNRRWDKRIKYKRNLSRLGIALNIRSGIEMCSAEYFCLLSDDDFFESDFVEKLILEALKFPKIGCVFSDHWIVNNNGVRLIAASNSQSKNYGRDILKGGVILDKRKVDLFIEFTVPLAVAAIVKKKVINLNEYPTEIDGAYDRWLLLQCVTNSLCSFAFVKERLSNYRIHNLSGSETNGPNTTSSILYVLKFALTKVKLNKRQIRKINLIMLNFCTPPS